MTYPRRPKLLQASREPLRRTTEQIVASGDRSLRVGAADSGEFGALARAIDAMLDALAGRDCDLERAHQVREQQFRAAQVQQRSSMRQLQVRAQTMVDETAEVVMRELRAIKQHVERVCEATTTIGRRVGAAVDVTQDLVGRADRADGKAALVGRSLHQVNGLATTTTAATREIADMIGSLERDVASITASITEMTQGIAGIDEATEAVSGIAAQQQETVVTLDHCVQQTMDRLASLANLGQRLERRREERVGAFGQATVRAGGRAYPAQLMNVSESGAGLRGGLDVPFNEDSRVDVEITLDDVAAVLPARIQHARTDRGRQWRDLGVQFVDVRPESLVGVRSYVASHRMDDSDPPSQDAGLVGAGAAVVGG